MNFKTTLTTTTLAGAMALSGSAWAFPIDLDGTGGAAPTRNVATIDPAPGNAIVTCLAGCTSVTGIAPGNIVQNFGHSTVAALLDAGGGNVSGAFAGNHEWTVIFGFAEAVVVAVPGLVATFATVPFGINFFEIYYSPKNADNLTGTGFTDGTKILGGTILPYDGTDGTGFSSFTISSASTVPLDSFVTDNYTAIDSITGVGSTKLKVSVGFQDFDFFKAPLTSLTMTFDSTLNDPFTTVNPSSCFYTAAGQASPVFLGAGNGYGPCDPATTPTGSVGSVNGVSGPNNMFQVDASIPMPGIPEPGMLALLGLGFAATGLANRRRRSV